MILKTKNVSKLLGRKGPLLGTYLVETVSCPLEAPPPPPPKTKTLHGSVRVTITSKKNPVLPHGKTAWGVVKRVRVVKTREGVVKTKLEVVFWNATMTNLLCPLTGHASCFTDVHDSDLYVTCTRTPSLASQGRRSIRQQAQSRLALTPPHQQGGSAKTAFAARRPQRGDTRRRQPEGEF